MKTKFLIISCVVVLLLVGCGEATQPAPTSTLPPPNPYAYDAFIAFCKAAEEGNLENALQVVTEDITLIFEPEGEGNYEAELEGYSGVEEFLNQYEEWEAYDCRVQRFEFNGDDVNFWWTHRAPFGMSSIITSSCICNGTMQEDKIQTIVFNCLYEWFQID